VLAVAGPVAVAAAWQLIRSGRGSVWSVNGILIPALGILSLLTGVVDSSSPRIGSWWALFLGVTAGLGLYAATVAFMALAGRWPLLARHTSSLYENTRRADIPTAAGISAWVLYVAANAVSGSVPIVLGALVSGAAWTALASLTGGVLASVACHIVWTALMVAVPPVPKPR
jgi:hypothetical protein